MVSGNSAELLPDYNGTFDAMIAEIDVGGPLRARRVLHPRPRSDHGTVFPGAGPGAERGVAVRVLSDHLAGLMFPGRKETIKYLQDIGAEYHPMLPVRPWRGEWQRPDLRNHRKIVVVDGRVGFTGSQNLIDASYNKKSNLKRGLRWHELMMRIEGPAVRELDAVFATDWYSETDVLLPLEYAPPVTAKDLRSLTRRSCPADPASTTTTI